MCDGVVNVLASVQAPPFSDHELNLASCPSGRENSATYPHLVLHDACKEPPREEQETNGTAARRASRAFLCLEGYIGFLREGVRGGRYLSREAREASGALRRIGEY